MKPVIGIVARRYFDPSGMPFYRTNGNYVEAVGAAGGTPVQIPLYPGLDAARLEGWLALCDGFVIPGGPDLLCDLFGEPALPGFEVVLTPEKAQEQRDELALIRLAIEQSKPMLAICLGEQEDNVALGGTLIQDLPTVKGTSADWPPQEGKICHRQKGSRTDLAHTVRILPGTLLEQVVGCSEIGVNTFHHQAVDRLAEGLTINAYSPDGIVEGVEWPEKRILGVQWHPENLACAGDAPAKALFRWVIEEAAKTNATER